jgi:hypothetical protein
MMATAPATAAPGFTVLHSFNGAEGAARPPTVSFAAPQRMGAVSPPVIPMRTRSLSKALTVLYTGHRVLEAQGKYGTIFRLDQRVRGPVASVTVKRAVIHSGQSTTGTVTLSSPARRAASLSISERSRIRSRSLRR